MIPTRLQVPRVRLREQQVQAGEHTQQGHPEGSRESCPTPAFPARGSDSDLSH